MAKRKLLIASNTALMYYVNLTASCFLIVGVFGDFGRVNEHKFPQYELRTSKSTQ